MFFRIGWNQILKVTEFSRAIIDVIYLWFDDVNNKNKHTNYCFKKLVSI